MFWGQTSRRILHHPARPVITSTFREAKLKLGHHITFKDTKCIFSGNCHFKPIRI